jgi:hypothetical protein
MHLPGDSCVVVFWDFIWDLQACPKTVKSGRSCAPIEVENTHLKSNAVVWSSSKGLACSPQLGCLLVLFVRRSLCFSIFRRLFIHAFGAPPLRQVQYYAIPHGGKSLLPEAHVRVDRHYRPMSELEGLENAPFTGVC